MEAPPHTLWRGLFFWEGALVAGTNMPHFQQLSPRPALSASAAGAGLRLADLRWQMLRNPVPPPHISLRADSSSPICRISYATAVRCARVPYGYLMRDNKPYQKYLDMKIFELKEDTYKNPSTGEPVMYLKTRVTAKGQEYLIARLDEILEKQTA